MIPLIYTGDGAFRASSAYHQRRCDKMYLVGELVTVEPINERSMTSHAAYFALLDEYWQTLPERLVHDFPSPTHLRKWGLISAGYCSETKLTFPTFDEAEAAEDLFRELDTYAVCDVVDNVLTVWRAKSQNLKAMDKVEFEKSKQDVLAVVRRLLETGNANPPR